MKDKLRTYYSVFKWVPDRLKIQIGFALIFSVFASMLEVLSISSIVPILLDLTSETTTEKVTVITNILGLFGEDKFYLVAVLLFACSIGFRIFNFSFQVRTSHRIGVAIGGKLIQQTLAKPFSLLSKQKTSSLITDMVNRVDAVVAHLIFPILNIISSLIITLVIGVFIASTVGSITFFTVVFYFLAFYALVFVSVKGRLRDHAVTLNTQNEQLVGLMEEIFNARREIIQSNVEKMYSDKYLHSAVALRGAMASVSILSQVPRFLTEFIAFSVLILLLSIRGWVGVSVTEVGLLLFTLQKLVPYVHGIYTSYTSLTAGYELIDALNKSLGTPSSFDVQSKSQNTSINSGTLRLVDVSYSYPNTDKLVLKGLNLEVRPGEVICIKGRSGSGKTTLLNIIAGLETQNSGDLIYSDTLIENHYVRSYRKKIFYLGQSPYIKNASLQENVTFPFTDCITEEELNSLLERVDLPRHAVLSEEMGEGGNQVSGGQAQRIALLRALFRNVDLLLLDEPTSALDSETAETVMRSILSTNKSVIMITHNTPKNEFFDKIFQLDDGKLFRLK